MRAVVCTAYGKPRVLKLAQLPEPQPKSDEIKIKIHAATVTTGDCEARRFDFPSFLVIPMRLFLGVFRPRKKVLGQELAGEVVAVGDGVSRFAVGDRVYAATMFRFGAYAEYICLPEKYPISPVPEPLSFSQAATLPTGGVNGLHFVTLAQLAAGQRLLINGAGGSIGTYALQIARNIGVTVDCVDSREKLSTLTALGAEVVFDYQRDNPFAKAEYYDAIIDVIGRRADEDQLAALKPRGRYILGAPGLRGMIGASRRNRRSEQKIRFEFADYRPEHLQTLNQLVRDGKVKPVMDGSYPLEQLADAHAYVDTGCKTGNVAIMVTEHSD